MSATKSLGELLVVKKMVNASQLEEARKEQRVNGGKLGAALVRTGAIGEDQLAEFLSEQYNVASIDLNTFEPDENALKALSADVCKKYTVIPVSKVDKTLVVAFADPSNMFVRDDIAFLSRLKVEVVVAPEFAIQKAIERCYAQDSKNMGQVVDEMEVSDEALNFTASLEAQILDKGDKESAPVVRFVSLLLTEAIKCKASDIHIEPYEKRLRVRFRIDGVLHEKVQPPPGIAAGLSSRIKIMAKLDIAERRRPQDGRIKVKTANGMAVDLRVSVLPTLFGEKIVMRILDKSNLKLDLTDLGFEKKELDVFLEAVQQPQGMVLVTGPTGSGKTTTLYSALSTVNDPQLNISTAEDPVEFNLDGINQVQVQSEIGFGFPEALRSFLRQDPDVILVGEIRDLETAEIAFKASNTGHLVLSTLHTNDAPTTVSRLLDMGVQPYLITSTISLIVAQRLGGRICGHCKKPEDLNQEVLLKAGVLPEDIGTFEPFKGSGCATCNGSGIKGRVAIYEILQMSTSIKEAILKGAGPVELKRAALKGGMISLRQAALKKFKMGLISLEEVLTSTVSDDQV